MTDTPGHGSFILEDLAPFDWRTPQNDNLWQGVNGANNPCPPGFRLPTEAEFKTERISWGDDGTNTAAFASPLKLVTAGSRNRDNGEIRHTGSGGYYWCSTEEGTQSSIFYFTTISDNINFGGTNRANGASVRCIQD